MGNNLLENTTDEQNVFKRTFSILIIGAIISYDQDLYIAKFINYVERENDYRGYILNHGWAHAISHQADVFGDIVRHRFIDAKLMENVLAILARNSYRYDKQTFINNVVKEELTSILLIQLKKMDAGLNYRC
ncbi:DUF2785 domain-containing protein [Spirochaeta cellobiosiphila]|uniref:DUF2785 domain-containing protein n=1 Tax=Spirochaeta cellobiosiphila TaxID=504483 RepID=UPI0003F8502E|nr:DUF2785 domain-containing protein [Spirochaeta cellobiosiphila]